jgi:hypothetical protein
MGSFPTCNAGPRQKASLPLAVSFQCYQEIRGYFSDAFEALILLTRFLLAQSPEGLRSETIDLLLHQTAEFVSDRGDIAGVHEAGAFMASASDDAATGGYEKRDRDCTTVLTV